ncbi:DUF998 domain-containing protein [Prauserella muralis]|uniref:Uncharacterized protein n=1 Tax=Prauserella muralis TaxID=588067 RepID=A0A2V4BB34_9PSEU|nr:DUF998 domain-containing protein [Prauserella muralis]PXY32537.1 hypothetical protein BAY60_09815 [Prauserella muralis]TWE23756.1 uncharacterized protein DUF998 [Prauserella muralis]
MPSVLHRPTALAAVRRTAVALLVAGVLAHLAWLLEYVLDTGLSPLHAAPAALGAQGVPHGTLFRTAEIVAGAAFVLASPPLLRLAPVHRNARVTVATVCVFGVLLILHGAIPPDCPGAAGAACAATRAHHAVSLALNVVYLAGPGGLLVWWTGGWRFAAAVVLAVEVLAWAAIVLLTAFGGEFVGVAMRVQLGGAAAILVTGIAYLVTVGREGGPRWEDAGQSTPEHVRTGRSLHARNDRSGRR